MEATTGEMCSPFDNRSCWCASVLESRLEPWDPGIVFYFFYAYFIPIAGCAAIFSNAVCLRAISNMARKNAPFWTQTVVFLIEIGLLVFIVLNALSRSSGAFFNTGADRLHSSYALQWLSAYGTFIPGNVLLTADLLAILSVAALRLYAMTQPTRFKQMDHKRTAAVVMAAALGIGAATSAHEYLLSAVVACDEAGGATLYFMFYNATGAGAALQLMAFVRLGGRMCALLALIILAVLVSRKYRRVGVARGGNYPKKSAGGGRQKIQKSSAASVDAHVLQTLLLVQAATLTTGLLAMYIVMIGLVAVGAQPSLTFVACMDGSLAFSVIVNFVFYLIMSKNFRKEIATSFRRFTTVHPTAVNVQPAAN